MAALKKPADDLRQIIELNRVVKPAEAEKRFRELLEECSAVDLRALDAEITAALSSFLPKKRRVLTDLLTQRLDSNPSATASGVSSMALAARSTAEEAVDGGLGGQAEGQSQVSPRPGAGRSGTAKPYWVGGSPLTYMNDTFSKALEKLSNFHIFQWGTSYRDVLSEYFDSFLDYLGESDKPNQLRLLSLVKAALSAHAKDIFKKGHDYTARNTSADVVAKSLAGLQRFLDLLLEFYSTKAVQAHANREALPLRQLTSAMIFGVLNGYAATHVGQPGSRVLPQSPESWADTLPFLTYTDLGELIPALQASDFTQGIQDAVLPLVTAVDVFLEGNPELAPLPAFSRYNATCHRLDTSIQPPPRADNSRPYEIRCYIGETLDHLDPIEQAAAQAVSAVVASLTSDLRGLLASTGRFSDLVVPADGDASSRLRELLTDIGYQNEPSSPDRPISYNWAAKFPLENPVLAKRKHVYRLSVRRLLQELERRNGVRLWCSVRRSGKTTACASDLGSTTSRSTLVTQTCESTGLIVNGGVFYKHVKGALVSGERLDDEFLLRTVADCLPAEALRDTRIVLILDEYETLFGDLQTAIEARPQLRYTVVQPLLNQLASFSRENLLIFMGQRPNAHFILNDQNQLSPVVEQDSFPLFTHDPASRATGEFHELLNLVMEGHVELEDHFVACVYEQTAGHPFLTVKLLTSFMDWLIDNKRPVSCLNPVRGELFSEFTRSNLDPITILNNRNYDLFTNWATGFLSPLGRKTDPWLHSVYSALRAIALCSPDSLALSLDDYTCVLAPDCVGTSPQELLSTATRANFLTLSDSVVRPRIPLLARIAAAVTPV